MVTCLAVEALVLKEVDGLLTGGERAELESHVGRCGVCRARREANLVVAAALSRRADAPVPDGFARCVSARLSVSSEAGWLVTVDWRRWTEWMVPVAAGLVLLAALAGRGGTTVPAASLPATATATATATAQPADTWALVIGSDGTVAAETLNPDVSSEELLAAMLGARTSGPEGRADER